MRRIAPLLVLLAAWASPAPVSAQCEAEPEPTDSVRAIARSHYTEGVEASTQERWQDAREAFQRAFDVAPFAPIVYNLATAQAQTGRIVEATENYRRFLRRCSSQETPELRDDANELLRGLEPRIGRLIIRIEGFDESTDVLQADGVEIAAAVIGAQIPFNPGTHQLRVLRAGEEVASTSLTLREGGAETVSMEITAPAVETPIVETGGGLDGGAVAGIVIGVTLAVAAAVLIPVILVLTSEPAQEPVDGTWEPARLPLLRF